MLKYRLLYFILSIFLTLNICGFKTDEPTPGFKLCDTKPGNITQSHLLEIIDNNCPLLNVFDKKGNILPIHSYTFGYLPPNYDVTDVAYLEICNNGFASPSIKDKLRKAPIGSTVIFTDIFTEMDGKKMVLTDFNFTITE